MVVLDKNINCLHESQVPLDKLFEDPINPLLSDDDYLAELPYINSSGFNQLDFVSNIECNIIDFE